MRKYRNVTTIKENAALFGILSKMKQRCYDTRCDRYKDYGGRGITICDEWLNDFDCFADWAHENGYAYLLTIDRIDNNKGYCPENCRWITNKEQQNNKRQSVWVTYKGETKTLHTWCQELNLPYDATHNRITKGWEVEVAFETPLQDSNNSFSKKCREHGINPKTVYDRIHKLGWDEETALNTHCTGRKGVSMRYKNEKANCLLCGKEFTKIVGKQKYCSAECRETSKKNRNNKGTDRL